MHYVLLIVLFLIFPVLSNSQNANANTSITTTDWFWPLIAISLALLFSIPCTLITVIILCHKKSHTDGSDESSIGANSSSSSSTTPVSHRPRCNHCQQQRAHHVAGLRSPPPPYRTSDEPANLFVSPSLPPPYDFHLPENETIPVTTNQTMTTVINVEPAESIATQSSHNPRVGSTLDVSTLTNPSLQTFQV